VTFKAISVLQNRRSRSQILRQPSLKQLKWQEFCLAKTQQAAHQKQRDLLNHIQPWLNILIFQMPFKNSNPVRLSTKDASPLPKYALIILTGLYIFAGLTWRGLWRQEASSFATMLTMAQGSIADWVAPNVAGLYSGTFGPLPYWIGAFFIKMLHSIASPFSAAQFAIALQDIISVYLLWLTVRRLGCRAELQPQRLAFGGEPSARAFGKMLADSSTLLFISTYGIAAHTHDTSEGATILLVCLLWLYGATLTLDQPLKARWVWGFGLAGIGLTLPFSLFVFFALGTLATLFFIGWRDRSVEVAPIVMLIGLTIPAAWLLQALDNPAFQLNWQTQQAFSPLSWKNQAYFAKNIAIFTWPIAPLSIWCLWRWRNQWQSPMVFLGVLMALIPLTHLFITGQRSDMSMLLFVPSLLLIAPFGLATLNRGRANIIEWFSVIVFSLIAILVWAIWLANWLGAPEFLLNNLKKLAPDFTPEFKWWPFSIALLTSIGWLFLLRWRATRSNEALWRSVVFSSGGMILVWSLMATLWMPWLDHTRSYAKAGKALSQMIPQKTSCVRALGLPESARGAIYYYANVPFVPVQSEFDKVTCPYIISTELTLAQPVRAQAGQVINLSGQSWRVIWTGERVSERKNSLVLLRQN